MQDRIAYQGITFDDVLLEPAYSEVLPKDADVRTRLTRNVRLNIPVLSSPMDTVTESELAIALAQEGGIAIIHKNMSVAHQTREVDKAKRSENGIITDPITLPPDATVGTARRMMEQHNVGGVPITVEGVLKMVSGREDETLMSTCSSSSNGLPLASQVAPSWSVANRSPRRLNARPTEKRMPLIISSAPKM